MFVDFTIHLVTLNLAWLAGFALNNLLWVFMFAGLAVYLWEGKKPVRTFFVVFTLLALEQDFMAVTGWIYLTGGFLTLEFLSEIIISLLVVNTPKFEKHLPTIIVLRFLCLLAIYNLFLVG